MPRVRELQKRRQRRALHREVFLDADHSTLRPARKLNSARQPVRIRRREPNNLSNRLAAVRRHRSTNLGAVEIDLLGQDRFRKVVAVALLLGQAETDALHENHSKSAD